MKDNRVINPQSFRLMLESLFHRSATIIMNTGVAVSIRRAITLLGASPSANMSLTMIPLAQNKKEPKITMDGMVIDDIGMDGLDIGTKKDPHRITKRVGSSLD